VSQDEEVILEAHQQAYPSPSPLQQASSLSLALGQTCASQGKQVVPPSCSLEACGPQVAQDEEALLEAHSSSSSSLPSSSHVALERAH